MNLCFEHYATTEGRLGSSVVTEPYRAPELVVHPNDCVKFGTGIDVWALGLTAFDCAAFNPAGELMLQKLLGVGKARHTFRAMVQEHQFYFVRKARVEQHPEVADCLREFVTHCTNRPEIRPSVAQASGALHG